MAVHMRGADKNTTYKPEFDRGRGQAILWGIDSWMFKQQTPIALSAEHCKDSCAAHESEILSMGPSLPHGAQLHAWDVRIGFPCICMAKQELCANLVVQ